LIDRYIDIRQKNKLASDNSLDTLVTVENATKGVVEAIGRELQTKYGGPNGIRIFVGDQSIQFNDISKTKDGDFLNEKKLVRDSICLSLGVPLGVLGVTDGVAGKGSGADDHQRNFIENTVRPLVQYVEASFNRHILSMFTNIGIDYVCKFILEDTDDAGPIEQMYDLAVRNGTLTPNEKRAFMNLPRYEGYGDVALVTAGGTATPLPQLENPPPPPAPIVAAPPTAPVDEDEQEKKLSKATADARRSLRELRKAMKP
jgi:HK97 family phage portal protein